MTLRWIDPQEVSSTPVLLAASLALHRKSIADRGAGAGQSTARSGPPAPVLPRLAVPGPPNRILNRAT